MFSIYIYTYFSYLVSLDMPSSSHRIESRTACIGFRSAVSFSEAVDLNVKRHLVEEIDARSRVPSIASYFEPGKMATKRCCTQDYVWSLLDFHVRQGFVDSNLVWNVSG